MDRHCMFIRRILTRQLQASLIFAVVLLGLLRVAHEVLNTPEAIMLTRDIVLMSEQSMQFAQLRCDTDSLTKSDYLCAIHLLYSGDCEDAEEILLALTNTQMPVRRLSWFWLGVAQAAQSRETEAIGSWRRAQSAGFFLNRGLILYEEQKYQEAIGSFQLSLALDSENGAAHQELGQALMVERRYEEAIEYLYKALKYTDNDERTYRLLGDTYLRAGDRELALHFLTLAVEGDLPSARSFVLLGRVYAGLNEYDNAAKSMREAMALASGERRARYQWIMARYLFRAGAVLEAIAEGQAALAVVNDPAWREELDNWESQVH